MSNQHAKLLLTEEIEKPELFVLLDDVRKYLPIQNPLYSFVHNNPLQFFETEHFYHGCIKAAWHYRAIPFKSIREYRKAFGTDNPEPYIKHAYENFKKLNLIKMPFDAIHSTVHSNPMRFRKDLLPISYWKSQDHPNYERQIHDMILPFISSYMDQGVASWHFPHSQKPLRKAFEDWIVEFPSWSIDWILELKALSLKLSKLPTHEAIKTLMEKWNLSHDLQKDFLLDLLFNLKGWSGMINRFESDPLTTLVRPVPASIYDWTYVLLLAHHALNHHLENITGQRYYCTPSETYRAARSKFELAFEPLIIWHAAYENFIHKKKFKCHFEQIEHAAGKFSTPQLKKYQAIFCIDDREEGVRRHLEKVCPDVTTYAAVGFFGVDMIYHGFEIALPTAQCPPVVTPQHVVHEIPEDQSHHHTSKSELSLSIFSKTRNFFGSLALSLLSSLPLSLRILSPGTTEQLRTKIQKSLFPKPKTKLILDGPKGFSIETQANIVWGILAGCGITNQFSDRVFIISHGSTSTNNPFRQAYGCGACGGNSGKPNSIAFCMMANSTAVRKHLAEHKNFNIPNTTLFVPLHHDTTTDRVDLLSDEYAKDTGTTEFLKFTKIAGEKNAVDRSYDFESYSGPRTPQSVITHVHDRAYDLSQPRPEYGHNRVALCFIGPREITKAVNLERRSFLVSYDYRSDPDGSHLRNIVLGAVPVCANINLDYYFSAVAPDGLGAGSKLPLNINGLIGVMTGSKGDLRIGLAHQMSEIHEVTRIHVVIYCLPQHLQSIVESHARLKLIVNNRWIHLYCLNPATGKIEYYEKH